MDQFDIYFRGEIMRDADPSAVRAGVARLFKVNEDAIDKLFSGTPLRVKQSVDAEAASRYRAAFRETGALVQIVPAGTPSPANRPAAAARSDASAAANPAPTVANNTAQSDTIDAAKVTEITITAPADEPVAAPVAGAFDLAAPGSILDHTPAPPPADIDTSALEALPPNTGSLADCRADKPPQPLPDISHLRIVED